jgi:subtilisin family serine protease
MMADTLFSEDYVEYIVEYNGDEEALKSYYKDDKLLFINDRYAIVSRRKPGDYMESFSRLEYNLFPKLYGTMETAEAAENVNVTDMGALESMGVINVRQESVLGLLGEGVAIGIIDAGIDISASHMRFYGGDTKILAAWDQTVEESGKGLYGYGREYSREEIQAAIDNRQRIMTDVTGHGTFCAGLAASVAPLSNIIAVKLKTAKDNLKNLYGVPVTARAFSETDIMTAVAFVLEAARIWQKPVCILIPLGSSQGSHTASSPLDRYIEATGEKRGCFVAVPAGNEGRSAHHYRGVINDDFDVMEIDVSKGDSFTLEIWGDSVNTYSVALEIPGGEFIDRISPRYDKSQIIRPIFGGGQIYVDYFLIEEASLRELIMMRFISPAEGIWRIRIYGTGSQKPEFDAWLPISNFLSDSTKFIKSDPYYTVTSPGNVNTALTACAFDYVSGNLYGDNSRGYTVDERVKPDMAAPGVNISGYGKLDEALVKSGTSISAAYSVGGAALVMEWSYYKGGPRFAKGSQIRQYLIRGARREDIASQIFKVREYPNPLWGYGIIDIYGTFESLRNL